MLAKAYEEGARDFGFLVKVSAVFAGFEAVRVDAHVAVSLGYKRNLCVRFIEDEVLVTEDEFERNAVTRLELKNHAIAKSLQAVFRLSNEICKANGAQCWALRGAGSDK